jgi:hypothetical protein
MRNAILMVGVCTLALLISPIASADMTLIVHEITGEVVETSGAPIPNAYVIVKWDGGVGGWGEAGSRCTRSTSVQTDEQGRFTVPAWTKVDPGFVNLSGELGPYSPGFTNVGWGSTAGAVPKAALGFIPLGELEIPPAHVKLRMKRFEGSDIQRAEYLRTFLFSTICAGRDIAGNKQIYQAIQREIRRMPKEALTDPRRLPGTIGMTLDEEIQSYLSDALDGQDRAHLLREGNK